MRKPYVVAIAFVGCVLSLLGAYTSASADEVKPDRRTEAAPSDKVPEAQLSAKIDAEIAAVLSRDEITPAPIATDSEFLRRVYMDTLGLPPTADEAAAFLDEKAKDKRAKLIDKLLADPRFGEHVADLWLNILVGRVRAKDNADSILGIWIAEQVNLGRGWHEVMHDIITAEGRMSDNPAAGYYAGKRSLLTPDIAGEATRHFTGVQIQCAQCHDHPYEDKWKVADFDGVASFFSGVKLRRNNKVRPNLNSVENTRVRPMDEEKLKKKLAGLPEARRDALLEQQRYTRPKFLEGAKATKVDSHNWRTAWADWVISDENSQTQQYIANRFWSFLFGMGILNPVDDFNSFNEPSHPALLKLLADDLRDNDFDVKRFYRAVLNSQTYQRSSAGAKGRYETWHFASYPVRQLTPEQFFAALTAVNSAAERQRRFANDRNPYMKDLDRARNPDKRMKSDDDKGKKYEWDLEALEKLKAQMDKMSEGWLLRRMAAKGFTRATDDDEMMEADGFTLSIDQALYVMNGQATSVLSDWSRGSVLDTVVTELDNKEKSIERLYLITLSRRPTKTELQRNFDYLKETKNKEEAWEDILFTLLVSSEFATVH